MRGVTCYTVCLLVSMPFFLFSQTPPTQDYDYLSINNMTLWSAVHGATSHNPITNGPGIEFPKGSGKHVMNMEGLMWGGNGPNEMHIGGSKYRSALQNGTILPSGEASTPDDPRFRIYKFRNINRSVYVQLPQAEQLRLAEDFTNWPVADGAPWVDADNNGIYEPDFDAWLDGTPGSDFPDMPGDEALWWVANDLDSHASNLFYGTRPIGIEVQFSFWALSGPGATNNSVYLKYKLINKGTETITDMYVSKWADPNIGDGRDDLAGYNDSRQVGYCYNGQDNDAVYGDSPPAVGHVLLQGPMVPSPGDAAIFNGEIRADHKNLPVKAFMVYDTLDLLEDEVNTYISGPSIQQIYHHMRGFLDMYRYVSNPLTLDVTSTMFNGDPLTNSGWVDGVAVRPEDRRYLMSTGPFDFAPGDTQEVVYAVTAAQGTDRFNSLELLLQQSETLYSEWNKMRPLNTPPVSTLAADIAIASVYPNPVSGGNMTLTIANPTYQDVRVRLVNTLGQVVANIHDGPMETGNIALRNQLGSLPAGVYIVELSTRKGTSNTKVIIR